MEVGGREKYIDVLQMHEVKNEKPANKNITPPTHTQTQKLLTRQFFILYGSRDRFKLGKNFLFSCAVLNGNAVFDVIWPRCQQCTAL